MRYLLPFHWKMPLSIKASIENSLGTFVLLLGFCLVFGSNLHSQKQTVTPIELVKNDSVYYPVNKIAIYLDTTKSLTFDTIQKQVFENTLADIDNTQGFLWHRFKIADPVQSDSLLIYDFASDFLTIYTPYIGGYKKTETGICYKLKKPVTNTIFEIAITSLPTDSIDFSRPFYAMKKTVSSAGMYNRKLGFEFMHSNNPDSRKFIDLVSQAKLPKYLSVYAGVFLISCLLFLVGFLMTIDKNFLIYSLYLFFTTTLFIGTIPFFFNILNAINPMLPFFLGKVSTLVATGLYFFFAIRILEVEEELPRTFFLSKIVLAIISIFIVAYVAILLANPFNAYTIGAFKWFRIIFGVLSFTMFVYLAVVLKRTLVRKLVLFGSFLLIIGNIFSLVLGSFFFFLNTAVVEILIFWAVVNYNNKINVRKKVLAQYELENERLLKEDIKKLSLAKSTFFANISHELRTPLTLMATPIQQKLQQPGLSAKERKEYNLILRNNTRLVNLVDELLDLSKLESGNLSLKVAQIDIRSFLKSQIEPFQYLAESNRLDFDTSLNITQEFIWIDREALQKIISNLFSNAIKYSHGQGSVKGFFTVTPKELSIVIKNTADPLTEVQKQQLFDRFYQANEFNEGAGIGLALVNELVELHQGRITVENEDGFIVFKVSLPCHKSNFKTEELHEGITIPSKAANAIPAAATITEDDAFANGESLPLLLIIEDNPDLRTVLKETFLEEYQIDFAIDGEEGLIKAISLVPDLILSDVMMPRKNGVELTQELKDHELTSHIPIILLTAKAGDENELTGIKSGADDYITKPFNSALLKSKMTNLIHNRKRMRARYSQEVILRPKDIAVTPSDQILLERIQSVLDVSLTEPSFSAEDFAKALGFSRMQLHRKLKALTGLSASGFIRSQRLKLAAQQLEKSGANVSEVCYQTGFNNLSYFAKCFKEAYGVTPSQYPKKD
ncbi:response regulator [Croceitalea sp. MTPC5]|uniref:response regulator n=1 Tax=Croceitalea sp. MTPC5 TaxID=3056565 RepID=UPI0030CF3CE1